MKEEIKINELKAINKKINELKKQYRKVRFAQIGEIYRILNKIVELKKKTKKRYTERSLEWEEDLNLTSSDIRTIFSYPYISSFGKKMIEEGKIEDHIICRAIRNNKSLREIQWQDKYIKGYINGEFKPSDLSELKVEDVKRLLTRKEILNNYDSYFKSVLKSLRNTKSRLKKRKKELENSPFKYELKKEVIQLYKFIKEVKENSEKNKK